jgi:ferrochelatase
MEIVFDLDVEAAEAARRFGLPLARAATPGTDPRFVAMISELVRERQDGRPPRALGDLGPAVGTCRDGCCGAGAARSAVGPRASAGDTARAGDTS